MIADRRAGADPVRILVNFALGKAEREMIGAVSPRLAILSSMEQEDEAAVAPGGASRPAPGWRRLSDAELEPLLAQMEVLFTFRFPMEWLDAAPNLRWVQLTSAGVDHLLETGALARRPELIVTTASGIHATPMAEHIIGYILAFVRGLPGAVRAQSERRWHRYAPGEAAGQTLGIVGYGPIARRTAEVAHALGMEVRVLRRNPPDAPEGPVACWYGPNELEKLLAASDFLLLAAPHTPATHHLINAEALAAMRTNAILINIARGALVDEPALVAALAAGRIGGAALDVFEVEPLPESSPLWAMSNVLITPHLAGANPHYNRRATGLFCDNLTRYLSGEPLINRVDTERGY